MALDASNPNTLYVGDYDPGGCGEAELDKSVDGGSTWTHPYGWGVGPVNALVTDPKNLSTLYAGTPEGVFKGDDGGANWSNIGLSLGVTSLALDAADQHDLCRRGTERLDRRCRLSRTVQEHRRWHNLDADQQRAGQSARLALNRKRPGDGSL